MRERCGRRARGRLRCVFHTLPGITLGLDRQAVERHIHGDEQKDAFVGAQGAQSGTQGGRRG